MEPAQRQAGASARPLSRQAQVRLRAIGQQGTAPVGNATPQRAQLMRAPKHQQPMHAAAWRDEPQGPSTAAESAAGRQAIPPARRPTTDMLIVVEGTNDKHAIDRALLAKVGNCEHDLMLR